MSKDAHLFYYFINILLLILAFSINHLKKYVFNQSKYNLCHSFEELLKKMFLLNLLFCILFVPIDTNYGFLISYLAHAFISPTLINAHPGPMAGEMFTM